MPAGGKVQDSASTLSLRTIKLLAEPNFITSSPPVRVSITDMSSVVKLSSRLSFKSLFTRLKIILSSKPAR